ncbi:MAG: hypothetical protein U9R60_17625 [Bacteroidota bacterium]|nr:hypothetical protein [Bacteroidota bacterium]
MSFQTIEKILQKYFEGDTSLQEEEQLKSFFQQDDVPPHLMSLKELFLTYSREKEIEVPDKQFDNDIISRIESEGIISMKRKRRTTIYMISGIAASILILITFFLYINILTKSIEDTFNDPQIAYNEAKNIMLFVSEKLNRGTEPLNNAITKVDQGVDKLKAMEKFNDGMKETMPIDKFNRIRFIFNNSVMP